MRLLSLLLLLISGLAAQAKLNVVATLPDFGAIAEVIGGEHVKVTTIARGSEDPHFVDARPSFVRSLNQADVLIEGGAELEVGWLPPLLQAARNGKILADAPGHLIVSRHVTLIDVPTGQIDRSMGDVHPGGNPHYWLDPVNGKAIAGAIAETFAKLDPPRASDYRGNAQSFSDQIDKKLLEWEREMQPFRGTKMITYHKSFDYFARRFGLEIIGQLEPRPGLEPTASHINSLTLRAKEEGVKLILIEPFRRRGTAAQTASNIGAKLLIFPDKVGATEKASDYLALFEQQVALIREALGAK
jgi:zinc/manganese transport system substrate-binding protein